MVFICFVNARNNLELCFQDIRYANIPRTLFRHNNRYWRNKTRFWKNGWWEYSEKHYLSISEDSQLKDGGDIWRWFTQLYMSTKEIVSFKRSNIAIAMQGRWTVYVESEDVIKRRERVVDVILLKTNIIAEADYFLWNLN